MRKFLEPVLFIDTSQTVMTVALFDTCGCEQGGCTKGGDACGCTKGDCTNPEKGIIKRIDGEKSHSAKLLPIIDEVLKEACLTIADIDIFALVTGTGSFTGLRVGLATLKGLVFDRNAKIFTVNTDELGAYYTAVQTEVFSELKKIVLKLCTREPVSISEVVLTYENPEAKRTRY